MLTLQANWDIVATECGYKDGSIARVRWNQIRSKKIPNATWKIQYGDGSTASGDVYTDNVTVGGITVKGQAVEAAQKVSSQFAQDVNNDGPKQSDEQHSGIACTQDAKEEGADE